MSLLQTQNAERGQPIIKNSNNEIKRDVFAWRHTPVFALFSPNWNFWTQKGDQSSSATYEKVG